MRIRLPISTLFATLMTMTAASASIAPPPSNDPLVTAGAGSVAGGVAFGFLSIAGDDLAQAVSGGVTIGPALSEFTINGFLTGPVLLNVFAEFDPATPALQGELVASDISGESLEFLFANTGGGASAALNVAFGDSILVLLNVERSASPFGVSFENGAGVITTPVPLPPAFVLLVGGLVSVGLLRRRGMET